jgi:hypothetical protein
MIGTSNGVGLRRFLWIFVLEFLTTEDTEATEIIFGGRDGKGENSERKGSWFFV